MPYSEFLDWCKWYELRNKDNNEASNHDDVVDLDNSTPEQIQRVMKKNAGN